MDKAFFPLNKYVSTGLVFCKVDNRQVSAWSLKIFVDKRSNFSILFVPSYYRKDLFQFVMAKKFLLRRKGKELRSIC